MFVLFFNYLSSSPLLKENVDCAGKQNRYKA